MAALMLRTLCMAAPSEISAKPGSPEVSSSSSAWSRSGPSTGRSALADEGPDIPKPIEAHMDRKPMTPAISPVTRSGMPPSGANFFGRARMASPATPPRPVGSGQRSEVGKRDRTVAAEMVARTQRPNRNAGLSSRLASIRRMPHASKGSIVNVAASPKDWMSRSANTAPAGPSQFLTGPEVAWLRLGS